MSKTNRLDTTMLRETHPHQDKYYHLLIKSWKVEAFLAERLWSRQIKGNTKKRNQQQRNFDIFQSQKKMMIKSELKAPLISKLDFNKSALEASSFFVFFNFSSCFLLSFFLFFFSLCLVPQRNGMDLREHLVRFGGHDDSS